MVVVTENAFGGLWNGAIDKKATSVINADVALFNGNESNWLFLGEAVFVTDIPPNVLLPEVNFTDTAVEAAKLWSCGRGR